MSTQTATQPQTTNAQTTTGATTAVEGTTTAAPPVKKQKITDRIVSLLTASTESDQLMTVSEIYTHLAEVSKGTVQATLSQLVKAGRVSLVKTGKRQPGYKVEKKDVNK
jgi:predicted transcriptional regulator of viral defense system